MSLIVNMLDMKRRIEECLKKHKETVKIVLEPLSASEFLPIGVHVNNDRDIVELCDCIATEDTVICPPYAPELSPFTTQTMLHISKEAYIGAITYVDKTNEYMLTVFARHSNGNYMILPSREVVGIIPIGPNSLEIKLRKKEELPEDWVMPSALKKAKVEKKEVFKFCAKTGERTSRVIDTYTFLGISPNPYVLAEDINSF